MQTFFVIIFSIYLFLEREDIKKFIVKFFKLDEKKFVLTYDKIETQLGAWVRGQLILCFAVGILTYIFLTIFQVPYALPLALLSGILEIIPVIGPVLTGVILTIIGLTISPTVGIICLVISIAVQQIENNFLVPFVMRKAVGLSPVITIMALLIGQQLMGVLGAIISVPIAAVLSVLVGVYLDARDIDTKI
jgi:predicted PurR-regulated permease PerM